MPLLDNVSTPHLILERDILENNIQKMRQKASQYGVKLRTHLKTAKCREVASLLVDETNPGITVSTLTEAEYFAAAGYTDILYAVSIEPSKFERAKNLYEKGVKLQVILDDVEVARKLAQWTQAQDCQFTCLIEVDTDAHRAGIAPDAENLIELASVLHEAKGIVFSGVMTHGGGSYDCKNMEQAKAHAEIERQGCVHVAKRIREASIPCPVVSIGSTPTIIAGDNFDGVTEIRPGVYVFFDLFQMGLGACQQNDIALTVLARVIGHNRKQNRLFIDAGGLALSKDRSTSEQVQDFGYGLVCDADGQPVKDNLIVNQVNQEHGVIDVSDSKVFENLPIGSLVRIMPNHACMTAAAYNEYFVVQKGKHVANWARCNGWSSLQPE